MSVKVRKRNGSWWVFIDHEGRRKAKKVGAREAAERVKRELEARLVLGDLGVFQQPDIPTLKRYSEQWLRLYAEVECKPATVASYRQLLRLYLYPRFGEVRLDAISRNAVKDFLASLVAGGKFSRNTLRLIVCTLRVIFNAAVEDNIVDRNPAARLGRFTKSEKPKFQASPLTSKEAFALLGAAETFCPGYYPLFLIALRAGLRRGELIALKWGDIQFGENDEDSNRFILVQRNHSQGEFTTPKSNKSRRVDLSRQLRNVLAELRDKRLLEAFLAGRTSIADDLIFPSKSGNPLDGANLIHYYFAPCIEKAGLRHIRFHDLRHTFGSHLIQRGASLAYVKEQMGHSSIQVTVDTYGHLIPGADIAWVDRLDEVPVEEAGAQPTATQAQPATNSDSLESLEVIEVNGDPGRTRTCNPLIKSQLLYH
jgi:integrase